MQSMLRGFARSLAAFLDDLSDLKKRVTVVTISEFGRRLDENSGGGLDHGWGNMMLVAGAGVKGGKYYANGRASQPATSARATSRSRPTTATCSPRSSRTG